MKKIYILLITLMCVATIAEAQFQEVPIPVTNALYSGAATIESNGWSVTIWVCGANGAVYRGHANPLSLNWINAYGNLPNTVKLVTLAAIDSLTAFAAGNIGTVGYIYKTTNGGINWAQEFSQSNGQMNAIWMRNASTGFVEGNPVGGRWSLWRTTNGGNTWDSTGRYLSALPSDSGYNNSMWCIGDTILFGTNNSKINFSSNYGMNWTAESTSPEVNIYSIYWDFYQLPYTGQQMFAGTSGSILKSSNYGMNWSIQQNVPGTGNICGICSYSGGVDMLTDYEDIYSRSNKIYQGYQGSNWSLFYTAPSGNYTFLFQKRNEPPIGYQAGAPIVGVRDNGGVSICFACRWGGIKKIGQDIPNTFSLSQNYPNPFNPSTKIRFDISPPLPGEQETPVSLKIYDILGREVEILVNEQLKPGSYEVEWNGTNYSSGVYWYRLISGDPSSSLGQVYIETKKMVLLK